MTSELIKENKKIYLVKPLILGLIIDISFFVLIFFFLNIHFYDSLKVFALVLIVQFFLHYLPLGLFYYNYKEKSKGVKFKILEDDKFCYIKNGKINYFTNSDIEKVVYNLSIPLKLKNPIFLSWHDYYFIKIFTQKENYIVTCLMIENDIEEFFDNSSVEKKGYHFAHMIPK